METRICKICQNSKPITNFRKTGPVHRNNRIRICRICSKKLNPEKTRRLRRAETIRRRDNGKKAEASRRNRSRLKLEALLAYSPPGTTIPICACCKESIIDFLSLDHIDGGGNIHRRSLSKSNGGSPSGTTLYRYLRLNKWPKEPSFQVLCFNCNMGRSINNGICPHTMVSRS